MFSILTDLKNDIFFDYLKRNARYASLVRILSKKALDKAWRGVNAKLATNDRPLGLIQYLRYKKQMQIVRSVREADDIALDDTCLFQLPIIQADRGMSHISLNDMMIPLASVAIPVSDIFTSGTCANYSDPEDNMAMHRFIWLQTLLHTSHNEEAVHWGWSRIVDWAEQHPEPCRAIEFESYTIAERLVNWLFFALLTDREFLPNGPENELVRDSVGKQLSWLIKNLEYHGGNTNNHILNDARALYICGSLLGQRSIAEVGRQIVLAETDIMIPNGALMEGSSHYQMLITKWFLDMYVTAGITGDHGFLDWMEPRLVNMLAVCTRLQSKFPADEFPLFGDISPDLPPEYFLGFPFSVHSATFSPWYRLFSGAGIVLPAKVRKAEKENPDQSGFEPADDGVWCYIEDEGIEVWMNDCQDGNRRHGHNDNGSIIVFFKGEPIIVDLGLADYRCSDTARTQEGWKGHNTPCIERIPFDIDRSSYMNDPCMRSTLKIITRSRKKITYCIASKMNSSELVRSIELMYPCLFIEDRVRGCQNATGFDTLWHINDELIRTDNSEDAYSLEFHSHLTVRCPHPDGQSGISVLKGKRSKRYGDLQDVCSILREVRVKSDAPVRMVFDFSRVS